MPTSFRSTPSRATRSRAARPTESSGSSDEVVGLVELHDPAEPGLVRVRRRVELVAVERHAGLETEGVAGAEPDGSDAVIAAGRHERVPQLDGAAGVHEDLEAV